MLAPIQSSEGNLLDRNQRIIGKDDNRIININRDNYFKPIYNRKINRDEFGDNYYRLLLYRAIMSVTRS